MNYYFLIALIRTDFSRASAPVRLSFREQELVEERRQKEERRKEEERWKEGRRRKREEQEEAEEREREYWRMNTVSVCQ